MRIILQFIGTKGIWHSSGCAEGMTLRLTTSRDVDVTVIKADGHLDSEVLSEFRTACSAISGPFRLDLSELLGADQQSVQVLRELRNSGVELQNIRPFLRMLIEREG